MKKTALIAAAIVLALPLGAFAQGTADSASKAKPTVKHKAKKEVRKRVPRKIVKAVEANTPVSKDTDITLSPADLAIAEHVYTGAIKCELGANVEITADAKRPGFFNVATKGARYHMHPVESRTGAIRLEDPAAGALWLQISNKSMLMNQKQGLRLADDCQSSAQLAFAEQMKKNPPKSLFEGADPVK